MLSYEAAKIVVGPPLAEPLSRGVAFIHYRTKICRSSGVQGA